jgi:hypothetical protein
MSLSKKRSQRKKFRLSTQSPKQNQKPLTLALSRRERELTEVITRVTPT